MKRVLKWSVPVDDQPHEVGAGKVVLIACQTSVDTVEVWTEETDGVAQTKRTVIVHGTGHGFGDDEVHIGSVMPVGELVWHVYELPKRGPKK